MDCKTTRNLRSWHICAFKLNVLNAHVSIHMCGMENKCIHMMVNMQVTMVRTGCFHMKQSTMIWNLPLWHHWLIKLVAVSSSCSFQVATQLSTVIKLWNIKSLEGPIWQLNHCKDAWKVNLKVQGKTFRSEGIGELLYYAREGVGVCVWAPGNISNFILTYGWFSSSLWLFFESSIHNFKIYKLQKEDMYRVTSNVDFIKISCKNKILRWEYSWHTTL